MNIKLLAELASKAMEVNNPQQRHVALTYLVKELLSDVGNIIEACKEIINSRSIYSDIPIRYNDFVEYYEKHERYFCDIEDSICLLIEFFEDVKDFESSPKEKWDEFEAQLKHMNQVNANARASKPKRKYIPDESRHVVSYIEANRRKNDKYLETQFGRYQWHEEIKDYFFYLLCREIVRMEINVDVQRLRSLLQKTFLYISLNNEKAMVEMELLVSGKGVRILSTIEDKNLYTDRANKYFEKAVGEGWMKKNADGFKWLFKNGSKSSLAYFLQCIYNPDGTKVFPFKQLEKLFNVTRLDVSLQQTMNGRQKWKEIIDCFFNEKAL